MGYNFLVILGTSVRQIARALLTLMLLSLVGLMSLPHGLNIGLIESQQALATGDALRAATALTRLAAFRPWQGDLWELAGMQALTAGQPDHAIDLLQRAEALGQLSPEGQSALGDAYARSGDIENAVRYWELALSTGGSSPDIHAHLVNAYHQLGDLEHEIEHRIALLELRPGDAQLAYRLGLALAAVSPQSSLAYLSMARDLDPRLAEDVSILQREISAARRVEDLSYSLLSAGRALGYIQEWELAAEALERAVELRPDYAEAWAYLGEARQHLGENGLPELQKAYKIDSDSLAANTFLALYWQRNSQYMLALDYLQNALTIDSNNPALYAEMARTHALNGDLETAQTLYEKAIDLAPRDPQYWRALAEFTIAHQVQLRETGLPAASQAVTLNPDDPASLDVLGQIQFLLGDIEQAQVFLLQAIEADPAYAAAHLHLALVHLEAGESALAYQQLKEAQSLALPGSQTEDQARRLLDQLFP